MDNTEEANRQAYTVRGVLLVVLGLLLILGCATTKVSRGTASQAIGFAETHVKDAQAANAAQHAPREFQQAKESLDGARSSFNKGDYGKAAKFADRATDSAKRARETALAKKKEAGKSKPKR